VDTINDQMDFKHTVDAMRIMGFTEEEKKAIFRIVAAILHLGTSHPAKKKCFVCMC
jgi:myosin heavy subunit